MITSTLLITCLLVASPENSNARPDVAGAVKRLVRQLDDDLLARREEAEKELTALGVAALDHMPPPGTRLPTESKERLARVRRTLENAAVAAATEASRVTLQGEMSLEEALESLARQSGNQLVDYRREFGQTARPITLKLEIKNKTFWEALDQILDQAQMTVYNYGGKVGAVTLVARSNDEQDRSRRAAYGGMLRLEGTQIEAVRDLRNPSNHSLRLALDVAWEPRLRPIALVQAMSDLRATDESGKTLAIDGREGEVEVPAEGDASATELYLPLQLPDRTVRKIASLRGKMMVLAPGRMETFQFADLEQARDVQQRRAGVTVTLEQLRKNVDLYEIRMRVKFDGAAEALESHRGWIYSNPAYLVDAAGEKIENAGYEATRQAEDEVGVSYKFVLEKGPAGCKFLYKTPAAILKLPVEYELRDIELP